MKRLALLRHAEAEPEGAGRDLDRILSRRGRIDSGQVAGRLPSEWPAFDLALVSPSARTRETWTLFGRPDVPVRFDSDIYDASVEGLLAIIGLVPEPTSSVIVVGHNPGIGELALRLTGGQAALPPSYPASGLALIEINQESWSEIGSGVGRLVVFVAPNRVPTD